MEKSCKMLPVPCASRWRASPIACASNKCYFLLLCPLHPLKQTTELLLQKPLSMNANFIRPWKELNEAGSAAIKFHVSVFQKTKALSWFYSSFGQSVLLCANNLSVPPTALLAAALGPCKAIKAEEKKVTAKIKGF